MSSPGMWQPTRKDGKNWEVSYSGMRNGEVFMQSRCFRVRANARRFIRESKKLFSDNNMDVTFILIKIN